MPFKAVKENGPLGCSAMQIRARWSGDETPRCCCVVENVDEASNLVTYTKLTLLMSGEDGPRAILAVRKRTLLVDEKKTTLSYRTCAECTLSFRHQQKWKYSNQAKLGFSCLSVS